MASTYKRRVKLIQPRLQLRLVMSFLGLSALALLFQFILFATALVSLAADMPDEGELLLESIPSIVLFVLGVSLCVILPLTFFVGVLVTFRVAGPLYRFEQHLKAIARGEDPGACRIRTGDELQEFCDLLNRALARLRERQKESELDRPAAAPESLDRAA